MLAERVFDGNKGIGMQEDDNSRYEIVGRFI